MSHDNDFPENHDALRTRTHARPRPAKKPLAVQEGQRIPARRADEHAYPAEAPSRSSEPRTPHVQASGEPHMPTNRKPAGSHAQRAQAPGKPRPSRSQTPVAQTSTSRPPKTVFAIAGACVALALVLFGVVHWQSTRPIDIMVNGQELQLPRTATVNDAFEAAACPQRQATCSILTANCCKKAAAQPIRQRSMGTSSTPLPQPTHRSMATRASISQTESTSKSHPT